jgi:5'-methylthioinosine phosphorylase
LSRQYAIIVGSGFDEFDGEPCRVTTRFGPPSAPVRVVSFDRARVFVLPRHGDGHTLPPHAVNYRANLAALQELGSEAIISLNTVGVITSIRDPGEIAVPSQIIDYTWGRQHTIHDGEADDFEHIDFTSPFSTELRERLLGVAKADGIDCYDGGVYAATQGPRLETAAEVDRLERDGADFIGMTAMPEAALARELGLEYACLSLVVNTAAGRGEMPIHADIEASTAAARSLAMRLLDRFFGVGDVD